MCQPNIPALSRAPAQSMGMGYYTGISSYAMRFHRQYTEQRHYPTSPIGSTPLHKQDNATGSPQGEDAHQAVVGAEQHVRVQAVPDHADARPARSPNGRQTAPSAVGTHTRRMRDKIRPRVSVKFYSVRSRALPWRRRSLGNQCDHFFILRT